MGKLTNERIALAGRALAERAQMLRLKFEVLGLLAASGVITWAELRRFVRGGTRSYLRAVGREVTRTLVLGVIEKALEEACTCCGSPIVACTCAEEPCLD